MISRRWLAVRSGAPARLLARPPAPTARPFTFGAAGKLWPRNLEPDPAVAKHFKPGELEKLCSLDFHFKEVKNRFKKLGL
jgi:hypothetical protein